MDERAEFVPLTLVIETLKRALHQARAALPSPQILRLSLHVPIFLEERNAVNFIRFPLVSDTGSFGPVTRLKVSIGPSGDSQVIVEQMQQVLP